MVLLRKKMQSSYIGKSNKCLENRVIEHNSYVTSAIYYNSISNNNSWANISNLR